MTSFVIDASITMAWCFEDECDEYADSVLDHLANSEAWVPPIWPLEVANVLLVAERRGRIRKADSARFVELLSNLPVAVENPHPRETWARVLSLGREHGLSAYDAAYLELAMRRGIPLAAGDGDLRDACKAVGVEVFV